MRPCERAPGMSFVKNATAGAKLRVETARARFGWLDVAISTFKRYSDGDGGFYAAGLTYYAFFSVFPLVLFSVSALGFVTFLSQDLKQRLLDAGRESFPLISEILTANNLDKIEEARSSPQRSDFCWCCIRAREESWPSNTL